MAISAVDAALWDLKARLLGLPLVTLLGACATPAPVYGSGGFTSYSIERLQRPARRLGRAGHPPGEDEDRPRPGRRPRPGPGRPRGHRPRRRAVRRRQRRLRPQAGPGAGRGGSPSSASPGSRSRSPPTTSTGSACSATGPRPGWRSPPGEYGFDLPYFRRMLEAGAVDVLQADATRCGGITGFLRVAALCEARSLPLSAHCGPSTPRPPGLLAPELPPPRIFPRPRPDRAHALRRRPPRSTAPCRPDLSRPGLGLEFKRKDAARFAV